MTATPQILEPSAPRMLPSLTAANRAFWTGGAAGLLLIPRCRACQRWVLPLGAGCPACGGDTEPVAVSGLATVYTYTLNTHQFHPDIPPPNLIAVVVLDEQDDLRLATNLVRCQEADVRCGMQVTVLFERHGEIFYPVFAPATVAI